MADCGGYGRGGEKSRDLVTVFPHQSAVAARLSAAIAAKREWRRHPR